MPTTERQWDGYGPDGQKALVERIAMRRLGTAQDIANAVVFFASDLAGFVNGQILQVDGGGSAAVAKPLREKHIPARYSLFSCWQPGPLSP